jgi:hypothetical protein
VRVQVQVQAQVLAPEQPRQQEAADWRRLHRKLLPTSTLPERTRTGEFCSMA